MRFTRRQPLSFAQRPQKPLSFSHNQVSRRSGPRSTLDFIHLTLRHSSALCHGASVPATPAGCRLLVLVTTVPQPPSRLPSCGRTLWTKAAPQRQCLLRPLLGLRSLADVRLSFSVVAPQGPVPAASCSFLASSHTVSFLSTLGPLAGSAATYGPRMPKRVP